MDSAAILIFAEHDYIFDKRPFSMMTILFSDLNISEFTPLFRHKCGQRFAGSDTLGHWLIPRQNGLPTFKSERTHLLQANLLPLKIEELEST